MAVLSKTECETKIAALYVELDELRASPVSEYQLDNNGQRKGVKYRSVKEILEEIKHYRRLIAQLSGRRALAVLRRGC